MTEDEWIACDDSRLLFPTLGVSGDSRKARLFAAECFRRLPDLLSDTRQSAAVVTLEQWAEGTQLLSNQHGAVAEARSAIPWHERTEGQPLTDDRHYAGLMLYRALTRSAAQHAISAAGSRRDYAAEHACQARLLREIFGNPFRPIAVDPAWRTSTVMALAAGAYDEKAFDRLPILADALQDAGCDSDAILDHFRDRAAAHVRGCWALDLVLGKE